IAKALDEAIALLRLARPREAMRICGQILGEMPKSFDALYLLGLIHFTNSDTAEHLPKCYHAPAVQRGAEGNEALRSVLDHVAQGMSILGRHEDALAVLDGCQALAPRNVSTCYARGIALMRLHRSDEALRTFDELLKIDPNDVAARLCRATILN